ncbi:hypothetical protein CPB83DRAFT_863232 [Crepidotus variabilis]|uniref:Uncharacterized protein n=1 Tax=Crepidotus variabilis TaxID=179855 RepID=A0A9P6JJF4_9AGAR|nr:hypothetical protein CPB83DRAFT_863232 [Crepidotus variabilis]
MSQRYGPLPTEPHSLDSSTYSPNNSLDEYEKHFAFDVEDEAPRRPRHRRQPSLPPYDLDPRFRIPTPSPWVRASLIGFILFLFWLAFSMRKAIWIAGGMGMSKAEQEVDPSY